MARMCAGVGAAAPADNVQPPVVRKALQLPGERFRRLQVLPFLVRQPGVRIAGNARRCDFAQRPEVVGHELRSGSAVQADGEQTGVRHRNIKCIDCLPAEHGAGALDGARNHDRNHRARLPHRLLSGEQRGLGVARVEAGLDHQDVHPALDQRLGLRIVGVAKLREGDAARGADRFRRRPHRPRDEARPFRCRELVRRLPRQLGRAAVQLVRFILEVVLGQHNRRAAERVRLDDVRAGFEIGAVYVEHDVRPRAHEHLVAALQRRTAEIGRGQPGLLQHGAHRAVHAQNAPIQRLVKCVLPQLAGIHGVFSILTAAGSLPCESG